jgi:hypothetical protein
MLQRSTTRRVVRQDPTESGTEKRINEVKQKEELQIKGFEPTEFREAYADVLK